MIDIQDIQSLTDFQRNTREHIRRLEKTGRPEVLTVNGRAKLVVQDARSYKALTARADRLSMLRRWDRAVEDCRNGRGRSVDEVFDELEKKYFAKKPRRKKSR